MEGEVLGVSDVIIEKDGKIVIVRRKNEPFKGKLDLPGGRIMKNEKIEEAAVREAEEETSLKVRLKEILGVYSGPERDPRGNSINVVFIAEPVSGEIKAGSDAGEAMLIDIDDVDPNKLGFDHEKILSDYKKWKKQKGTYWSTK